jgi:hypothetical protein
MATPTVSYHEAQKSEDELDLTPQEAEEPRGGSSQETPSCVKSLWNSEATNNIEEIPDFTHLTGQNNQGASNPNPSESSSSSVGQLEVNSHLKKRGIDSILQDTDLNRERSKVQSYGYLK